MQQTFDLSKSVAELKLTESELALFSAFTLIAPGNWQINQLVI